MNNIKQICHLAQILWNYKRNKAALNSMPTRLWIESTSVCNLRCIMCLNEKIPQNDKGFMDFSLYKKIIDEVKSYVRDIYLHHRGEPLLHQDLARMIRYAKDNGINVRFHTNGTLLNQKLASDILSAGPDLISFSIDGFTKETYNKIRINADFDKTISNISEFLKLRKAVHKTKPYVIIEEIEFPGYKDYYKSDLKKEFSKRFKDLGLDELIFKKLYNWAGDYDTPEKTSTAKIRTKCTFPWYASVILWDGTVSACPQDYFGKIKLGNIQNKTLKEIWNDNTYTTLRKNILYSLKDLSPCNKCDRLWRKQIAGVPFQYLFSFLNDNLIGYGRLRKLVGSYERNG